MRMNRNEANLIGTEKQVAWALDIRRRMLRELPASRTWLRIADAKRQGFLEFLFSKAEAAWWIDSRTDVEDILRYEYLI